MANEHFQVAALEKPEETTPPAITPAINGFAATLGQEPPQYVPSVRDATGLYGWCSDGVLEKVRIDGGSIRFGWTIWEWPNVLLTAEFHAVWVSPGGELIDITPKPQGEDRIVLVPDASYPPDFDFDKRPTNRRCRLYQPDDPTPEIQAHIARMKRGQLAYEQKRANKAGITIEQSLRNRRPPDRMVTLIDDFIRVCNEYDGEQDRQGAGYIEMTPRLAALGLEKFQLQEQIKLSRRTLAGYRGI